LGQNVCSNNNTHGKKMPKSINLCLKLVKHVHQVNYTKEINSMCIRLYILLYSVQYSKHKRVANKFTLHFIYTPIETQDITQENGFQDQWQ